MGDLVVRGPLVGEVLAVVERRDPLDGCETCGGEGFFLDYEIGEQVDCPCAEDAYRSPTPADLTAHLLTLSPDDRVALLVALLRAAPDEAVRAVDTCKVARGWVDWSYAWERCALGGTEAATASYSRHTGGAEWSAGQAYGSDADETAAMASADAALVADGSVLAGVDRG